MIGRQDVASLRAVLNRNKYVFENEVLSQADRARLGNSIGEATRQINELQRALNRHERALQELAEASGVPR
jgi:Mg2+ and Co2+ transporter CorA